MKLIGFFAVLLLVQVGCDRPPQLAPPTVEANKPIETTEWLGLSFESLIENVLARDKESLEEAHKAGRKQTVGAADGKWWLQSTRMDRVVYMKAIGDLVIALSQLNAVTNKQIIDEQTAKSLELHFGNDSLSAAEGAESKFSGRIEVVIGGRSFGDLADAVTKFYQSKPLLKDKSVLWVLAVPLYKELEESKPQDKRNRFNDTVKVPMKKKTLVN
jgi:hypothetical protein